MLSSQMRGNGMLDSQVVFNNDKDELNLEASPVNHGEKRF